MSYTKLYVGKETPLSIIIDDDVINHTFTITNSDGTNYDFSGWLDINLTIWDHRLGTVKATLVKTTNLTISSNIITLNYDYSSDVSITETGIYYYKITYNDSNSKPITVSFGDMKII